MLPRHGGDGPLETDSGESPARHSSSPLPRPVDPLLLEERATRAEILRVIVPTGAPLRVLEPVEGGKAKSASTVRRPASAVERMDRGLAVVAAHRHPGLIVLDLDRCAIPLTLERLEAIATAHGARRALIWPSGSARSAHVYYAVPVEERERFRAAVRDHRKITGMNGTDGAPDLDDRTDKDTRVPYSPPNKFGNPRTLPVDGDGVILDSAAVLEGLRKALEGTGWTLDPGKHVRTPEEAEEARRRRGKWFKRSRKAAETVAPGVVLGDLLRDWSPEDRAVLLETPEEGNRSDKAIAARPVVIRRLGASWSAVRAVVMAAPVFGKFADRGEEVARAWWEREEESWQEYREREGVPARPAGPSAEELETARSWWSWSVERIEERHTRVRGARLLLALAAVIRRRMLDGRGLESRPVAVRDLVNWGVATDERAASKVLRELEECGVLVLARGYDWSTPLEAKRWSMPWFLFGTKSDTRAPQGALRALPLPASPSPLWLEVGPLYWLVWSLLGISSPSSAETVGGWLGGSAQSAREWLTRLEDLGLVSRESAGRGVLWSVSGVDPAGAGEEADRAAELLEERKFSAASSRSKFLEFLTVVEGLEPAPLTRGAVLGEIAAAAVSGGVSRSRRSGRVLEPGEIFRDLSAAAAASVRAGPVPVGAPPG